VAPGSGPAFDVTPLYLIAFLSSLGFSIVIPFLVFLVTQYGGNGFVLGALGAAFWSAQLFGAPWLGALSDRIGRKRVLFFSQLGAMVSWAIFLGALLAPRVELAHIDTRLTGAFTLTLPLVLIMVARASDGLFNGSISVANAYLSDVTTEDQRKVGYARLGAATNLGFVVGPLISGLLARSGRGVIAVVVVAIALSATAAGLVHLRLPGVPAQPATPIEVARAGGVKVHKLLGGGCREHMRTPRRGARAVLAIPELRPMIALYFLVYLGFSMFTAALPIHAATELGWTSSRLGVLYTVIAVSLVATETLVLPRLTRHTSEGILGTVGCAMVMVCYLLMTGRSDAALFTGAILYGLGNGLMWPSYLSLLARTGPRTLQGTVQGVGGGAGSLASILGTLTGGVLFETIGATTFYVSAGALAVATLVFFAVTRETTTRALRRPLGMCIAPSMRREEQSMSIDLNRLLENQVYVEDVQNASEAIGRALEAFEAKYHIGARPFEVVAPEDPDETWVRQRLAQPLVYFCESEGMSVPKCGGVVVALFMGPHLYAIPAESAIRWAAAVLGTSVERLRDEYGTHEMETAMR
jgi:DHA1 family tetracycline resistance protein-like MFS transporter